jgi:Domain of unknown function (DU1801)
MAAAKTPERDPELQLASFLEKFTPEVAAQGEACLNVMRRRYPTASELVYDNFNALAIGFGPTERAGDAIFSIAVFPRWVSLFFLWGKGLPDPEKRLQGGGNQARHIRISSLDIFNDPAVRALMNEAVARAAVPFDPHDQHRLIIKSVAENQRPRRPERSKAAAPKTRSARGAKSARRAS